jgi:hypothetical protein
MARGTRVTFTAEAPEYWTFMFGDLGDVTNDSPKLQDRLLALYRDLVSGDVRLDDLKLKDMDPGFLFTHKVNNGGYDVMNPWNTVNGIAHLTCPSNNLRAELTLAAGATRLFCNASGDPLTYPDALCRAAGGNPNRHSDPTIIASVNALARLGMMVTLDNPAGIAIDHIDTSAWRLPGGIAPRDCWRIARGREASIARLVVEVPPQTGFTLSDLTIAGEPLKHGGQLAECVTVKLDVVATGLRPVTGNPMTPFTPTDLIAASNPDRVLFSPPRGTPAPETTVAFAGFGS